MLPGPARSAVFPYTTLFRSQAGVLEAQPETVEIKLGPRDVIAAIQDELSARFRAPLIDFAAFDAAPPPDGATLSLRSEEHTSELQSQFHLVCRLLLEKKKGVAPAARPRLTPTSSTCTASPNRWPCPSCSRPPPTAAEHSSSSTRACATVWCCQSPASL